MENGVAIVPGTMNARSWDPLRRFPRFLVPGTCWRVPTVVTRVTHVTQTPSGPVESAH
jgi:hypothetical protein